MLVTYYDCSLDGNGLSLTSKKETLQFRWNKIRKIQIYPCVGIYRNISGVCIYAKGRKVSFGIHSVNDYETIVKQIHLFLGGKNIKYIKGSWLIRFFLVFILPVWLLFAYYIFVSQIYNFTHDIPFAFYYLYGIVPVAIFLYNYPKNFKDSKVKRYKPELIIKYGPKILFNESYQKEKGVNPKHLTY